MPKLGHMKGASMRHIAARSIMTVVVGLLLLGGGSRAAWAGVFNNSSTSCCVCTRCVGGASSCAPIADAVECADHCNAVNATSCGNEVVNVSCSSPSLASECQLTGAPVVGTTGLTIVTVMLSAFGIVGLRRAARRQRA